jgi:hydroxypyruvate reductase
MAASARPEILLTAPLLAPVAAELEDELTVHRLWQAPEPAALLAAVADRVRALATTASYGASAELIDALPRLELVASFGVGLDRIDLEHARRRGVAVTNTPDVLNEDVADLAIALMLASSRRLCEADRFVRAGQWSAGPFPLARRVSGKRLGIVGLGRIGQEIAQRAEEFRMRIGYHQRHPRSGVPYRYYPSLIELAQESDFLLVIVPGGAATERLIDRRVMEALGPEGTLINVARGSVVDETALVEALAEGRLGAAALDVFAQEPHVPPALVQMDNVILQPHLGSATTDTRAAMGRLVVENLRAHFAGRPLPTAVE